MIELAGAVLSIVVIDLVLSGFGARHANGGSRFGAEDRNRGRGMVSALRLSF